MTFEVVRLDAVLTEGQRLAAVYDTILQAKFSRARDMLRTTCPPAPLEACRAVSAAASWWEILIDPNNRALDGKFEKEAQAAIDAAAAWTKREPKRAEAWFYLAGSYAPLTQWQALRGKNVAAARNGNRIRSALEKAIELDPTLVDAYFGIGMYHYWADVAPAAAKLLRMLLFLPGGDRKKGLEEMLKARREGVLLAGEADFQLHWLYLWFEHDTAKALELVRSLDARYPTNPVFLQRIAEIEHDYRHDHRASAQAWEELMTRSSRREIEFASLAEARARLGLAQELIEDSQAARALSILDVLAPTTTAPYGALSVAEFLRGEAYTRLQQRDRAAAAYARAIERAPGDDPYDIRRRSRDAIKKNARP
jgi:tetratricopeptide (TPR) repeat protein